MTLQIIAIQACKVARQCELHEYHNRDEWGEWKTKKAEQEYNALQRKLSDLDDLIDQHLDP